MKYNILVNEEYETGGEDEKINCIPKDKLLQWVFQVLALPLTSCPLT